MGIFQLQKEIDHEQERTKERSIWKPVAASPSSPVQSQSINPHMELIIKHLLDALKKLDPQESGWISESKARLLIYHYNDVHQLGLNPRFIQSIIMMSSDESESMVSLDALASHLKKTQ